VLKFIFYFFINHDPGVPIEEMDSFRAVKEVIMIRKIE
jgi:hypothetical protein